MKRFIPNETIEFIRAAIGAYTEYIDELSKRNAQQTYSSLFVEFKNYFASHSVDIENSLLGVHTSKALRNKCLQHSAQPTGGIHPGMLVAIPAGKQVPAVELAFGDYIFARTVTGITQDGNVSVTIDPCERGGSFVIPAASVLTLTEDQEKRINSRCRVEEIVSIPLQNIVNEFTPLVNSKIAEEITEFLDDIHFYYVDVQKVLNPAERLSFDSMPMLEELVGWFKQMLSNESFCDRVMSSRGSEKWKTLKQDLTVTNALHFHILKFV